MKKYFTLLIVLTAMALSAQAQVAINATNFPDENFRNWLLDAANINGYGADGKLTTTEIADVKEIYVANKGIKDLTGIEHFTALESLRCGNNDISTLDLSKNTKLTFLYITTCPLKTIDISMLTELERLQCGNQDLSVIDFSKNTKLKELSIWRGTLTSIDVSMLPELEILWCYETEQLTSLDLTKNLKLKQLICQGNQLTSLDFSNNAELKYVECYDNKINGAGMDMLVNSLPTIDGEIWIYHDSNSEIKDGNEMTKEQVAIAKAKGWKVKYLDSNDKLQDYEGVDPSASIAIDATNFPDENFRNWLLDAANINGYGADGKLTTTEIADVKEIYVANKGIKDLTGIEHFTALESLRCGNNDISTLDLSKNTKLTFLYITTCPLKTIDISMLTELERLQCGNQDLSVIDFSKNTKLKELSIWRGTLTSIDVSMLPELEILWCYETEQLTSLDLTKNLKLKQLICQGNQLTSLDFSNNAELKYVECYDNKINGAGMDMLVNSLPTIDGEIWIYHDSNSEIKDGNEMTKEQVAIAKAKGWKVKYLDSNDKLQDYEGVDPSASIAIDATNFPDENFRNWLLDAANINGYGADGVLTAAEIGEITSLDVYWKSIVDLKGIEFFTELTTLYCRNLSLKSLDVSNLTKLKTLLCYGNQLQSLNVSGCTELSEINCCINGINETEMGKFVESLPTRTNAGRLVAVSLDDSTEGNVITKEQVAAATAKGWAVLAIQNDKSIRYDGIDSGIESLMCDDMSAGHWYMLDGQQLQGTPTTKGIFINNGKKVVIK